MPVKVSRLDELSGKTHPVVRTEEEKARRTSASTSLSFLTADRKCLVALTSCQPAFHQDVLMAFNQEVERTPFLLVTTCQVASHSRKKRN